MLGNTALGLSALGMSSIISRNDKAIWLTAPASMLINAPRAVSFTTPNTPTIHMYDASLKENIRYPAYKIEFLRPEDETPYMEVTADVISDSGSVSVEKQSGARRTCNFELSNINGKYHELVENMTICTKFRVKAGAEINGSIIYFDEGVFFCDNPTSHASSNEKKISIAGTDKWSGLNGQHGGTLEGTYTISAGSKLGDFIRRTLNLSIVNDPIEPIIHSSLEDAEITYDITKSDGGTIADMFLDVALNLNCDIYYDAAGRLNVVPINDTDNLPVTKKFTPEDYSYIGVSKTHNNDQIYNSVLVIGENALNTETPIRFELVNNDLDDPNSVINVGVKKVYKVSEYTSGIDTEEKARWRAHYEMRNVREKSYSANIEYVDVLYLDVGQVIELHDEDISQAPDKYVVVSLVHNLGVNLTVTASVSKL